MSFTNNHGCGKKCLLSIVFSKRCKENNPTISVYLRASEITKRLIFDFLFVQRIGEYVYGHNNFKMVFHINQMFNDNTVLLMYHAHKNIRKLLKKKEDKRSIKLLGDLNTFLEKPIDSIKYKGCKSFTRRHKKTSYISQGLQITILIVLKSILIKPNLLN